MNKETSPSYRAIEAPPLAQPPFPSDLLKGQVALVTGGGSGMGFGMARAFAQAGADVVIVGRSIERLQGAVERLEAFGNRVATVACDVRKAESVVAAFDAAERLLGPITILANNAGANFPALAEQMSANAWRAVIRIAVDGTFLCSTEFARRCIARGDRGAIINNSAQYIWTGFPGDVHSATAKAAIVHMTKAQARDWKASGIRVNCIAAGFFPHPDVVGGTEEDAVRMGKMFPIGRVGDIREWGWLAALSVSPLTAAMSGETLMIDGGDRLRRSLMHAEFVAPRDRENVWGEMPL